MKETKRERERERDGFAAVIGYKDEAALTVWSMWQSAPPSNLRIIHVGF